MATAVQCAIIPCEERREQNLAFLSSSPLFGTIADAVMIMCGAAIGLLLKKRLPERLTELPLQGMALFVFTLGVGMAIKTQHPLVVIASIALGSMVGELADIEGIFERAAKKFERHIGKSAAGFSTGFVAATLLYCTGSMGVIGAFQEGLSGDPSMLLTKGMIDGMLAIAIGASLGFGVICSGFSVLIYQGILTLAAETLQPFMSEAVVTEMSAAGGLMLMAIGINLLGLMKVRVMNMIPAMALAIIFARLFL